MRSVTGHSGMMHTGRQFRALLWKNWLCRLRHPHFVRELFMTHFQNKGHFLMNYFKVLFLAEFLWPCILFMILTVLRFQEPPRQKESCFLQARDLPNRGVFLFVQGLLCNTGSQCRNISYEQLLQHHPRFQVAADNNTRKINHLAFLGEMQDFAEEVYETMEKAKNLQKLWVKRLKTPDSSYSTSLLTVDLNKTEDVILKLESLHQQPHIWDFLLSLPWLYTKNIPIKDSIYAVTQFLWAVLNSLTSLEDLDWLPLNNIFLKVSESMLNMTISTLTFLQEHGMAVTEPRHNLFMKDVVLDPQMLQADLKYHFGFDELHSERILNYSAQLKEVFNQWQKHNLLEKILSGTGQILETLRDLFEVESKPRKVAEDLHSLLFLLNDSLAVGGPKESYKSQNIFLHLLRLQSVLQVLPQWPALQRLLQLGSALRKTISQNLYFVQEVLMHLETSGHSSKPDGSAELKLDMDRIFWGLKQILNNVTDKCLNGHFSEKEADLHPLNSRIWGSVVRLLCQQLSSNVTNVLNKSFSSVKDTDHILQKVIIGHSDITASMTEEFLGWLEVQEQLSAVSLSCTQIFQWLGADALSGNEVFYADCKHHLISTVIFDTLEKVQSRLRQTHYWEAFTEFIRKTCEVARNVNLQESSRSSQFTFFEESPCYEGNMDWKTISDNYFLFLNHLLKSPITSIPGALNSTKALLMIEDKLPTLEDEQMNFLSTFVEFLEKLLPNSFNSSSVPRFHNVLSPTETFLKISLLWINHLKSLERGPSASDIEKLLKFGKDMTEKIQTLRSYWINKESGNVSRNMELMLLKLKPKLQELWLYDISEEKRAKLENLSTILNFSVIDYERIVSKSFWKLFHSDWPKSLAVNMDFVQLSEKIISSLYELGFMTQEQVSKILNIVCTIRNASDLFSTLPESLKQETDKMLTHMYQNVFKDKDSAFLLQICSSFHQHMYKFFSSNLNRESLLTFLTQISENILDIINQFHSQNISKAFALLSQTTSVLGRISELSYCHQLLSFFHFLKFQAPLLGSVASQDLEMIHAILTGLEQLFTVDKDFRISLFQYMSELFNGSAEALLGNECFALHNESVSFLNYSTDEGSSFVLLWAKILSKLSANGRTFDEFMATHCTISWIQMWTEIWESISNIFRFDANVFNSLRVGLNRLLDELENDVNISKSCQGLFPLNPARLLLNLFITLTHTDEFLDWNDFLDLSDLWIALGDTLITVKSLHPDKVEKSLLSMETALHQLKIFPLSTNISREFLYSMIKVFTELSNASEYIDRSTHLPGHFLSNSLTNYGIKFQNVISELRETILFLRNVSLNQDLLSCSEVFHNITKFLFEDDLLYINTSQRAFHILAMLNSKFSSENITHSLKGCISWIDVINHLYDMYNSSISQGHLQSILGSFREKEKKISNAMKLVSWVLNMKEHLCSQNKSNINCMNIYLTNVTDFLNVIFTAAFEKEKLPKFEVFLTFLNDFTNQIRMIINNLTGDFDLPSQSNWKYFAEWMLSPTEMLNKIPKQFQNIWLHLRALGKEIQKLLKDFSHDMLEKNFPSKYEKILGMFATSPKEKDLNSLGNSISHFAGYLAVILSQDLQNSSKIIPHQIMETVGVGIQVLRDVLNSFMPAVHHALPPNTGNVQVLKKVSSLMRSLKKADIDLIVDQLEQINKNLMGFFKNVSKLETGNLDINVLVGLIEKLVESSQSWNVNHLLKLSRLFPKDDVNVAVDVYYVLPQAARLLRKVLDKDITEALKDVYNFTLLHGITFSRISKENFAIAVKTLLDVIELVSDKPGIVSEALTCLPEIWCWNHTTSELNICNAYKVFFSPFYGKVAGLLEYLHLSLPENLQCSNKSSRIELTRKVVCVMHELVNWNSILLELSEVFPIKTPLEKIQEFWHKVIPYVLFSGNQTNVNISELCTGGSIKQVALQIVKFFKNVNFTKVISGEKFFDRLASLNKIFNLNEGTKMSAADSNSSKLKVIEKSTSGSPIPQNSSNSLVSPFMMLLNVNLTGSSVEALSNLTKKNETPYSFEELWLEFEHTVKDLRHNISHLISEINQEIKTINSVTPQNTTLQFSYVLENLNSSSLKTLEIIEDFLKSTENWLHKYANKNHIRMIQTLFSIITRKSSTDIALLAKDITTFLGYLKDISRESNFDFLLTHLLNQQQLTNFSVIQLLLENIIINSINNLFGNSQEEALNFSDTGLQIVDFINLLLNHTQTENGGKIISLSRSLVNFIKQFVKALFSFLVKENSENKVSLLKDFYKDIIAETSAVEMCRVFQQPGQPLRAIMTLQKVKMLVVHMFVIFLENPSLIKDIHCATLSCKDNGVRPLILSVMQGLTLLLDHYQEIKQTWSSPTQLYCESLSRNLSRSLEILKKNLENDIEGGCQCQPALGTVLRVAKSFEETLSSGNPIMTFFSDFRVTDGIKVKDLMKNITKLTEELQNSIQLSDETINCILEANISSSKFFSSALTVAMSGRCDEDILQLLVTFHKDETSLFAVKELCALPGSEVYSLIVLMSQNLNLRSFIYETLIPSEANSLLNSLLDVVSSLTFLLDKAQHVLEYFPEFLEAFQISGFLDVPGFQQILQNRQPRSLAFGSFQSVMKMICKEQASFLSNSNTFTDLPRVNDFSEGDKEKFNIPEDSTQFCLKLYQEILQLPNGALVWAFLKPMLHGKVLYAPNTPKVNEVIQKANYTFLFVDKIKTLSKTLLNISSLFQTSGNGQMFNQLQEALKNKFIRNFIESHLYTDVDKLTEKLRTYGGMLDKMLNHTEVGHLQFLGHMLINLSSCVELNRFQAHESVDLLETKARELMQRNDFLASVIFNNSFANENLRSKSLKLPLHIIYTIRTSILYSMRTDLVKNPFWKFHPQSLPADGFKYNYIFVPLQDMIERAIISVQTGKDVLEPEAQVQAIPYPCHTSDLFLNNVGFFFPLIMMLTWMVSVASMVRKLVYEREIRIEEYMRMMGVHPTTYFLAWFLENMAMLTLSSAILAIILKTSGIFEYSNALIIFLFLLDYGVSIIMMSYFLSTFFTQANTAAICTSLVYMISFLPYIVLLVLHNQLSFLIQTILCFLSTAAFGQGVFFVTFLEGQEAGIQWNNMYQSPAQGDMTFGWVCWMILFDSSLYFLCGWYFSNLIPGTFGLRKPWYFPFTVSYWKTILGLVEKKCYKSSSPFFPNKNFASKGSSLQHRKGNFEGSPSGVTLVSVTKKYEPNKVAIKDLTVTFYRDQITALLGKNGAGKTTVISMLTGLYPPTSGTIIINGKNLQTDLATVRMELGVCPQHDVLFGNLTVLEHLLLFASIKAPQWTKKELHEQVNKTLQAVELTEHQHKQTRALSGGMKRKLSIGIAFIGMSQTVVLDEPTSGVDPCSRRNIWDILLKYREGRTIIFTTHHLDEVEVLSDSVTILQQGQLRCSGPTFCLKKTYGQGLSLMLTREPSVLEIHDPIARVTSLIQTYVPQAILKASSGSELAYSLPNDKASLKGLFQALDQNLHHLHLIGYGISDTTLEEVFLVLLEDSKKEPHLASRAALEPQHQRSLGQLSSHYGAPSTVLPTKGGWLLCSQMSALLTIRFRHTVRAWKSTLSDLLLPVLFVALAMGLFLVRPLATNYPPLKMAPGHYERAETYFFSSEKDDLNLAHMLLRKFGDEDLLCAKLDSDLKNSSCWHTDPFSPPELQDSCGCMCPNGSARAPYLKNSLGHILLNLSAFNVEEYLLLTSEKPRLGGWSFGVQIPDHVEDDNSNISKALAKVWYNQKGFHSLPSYLNHLNNLILWRHLPTSVDWRQYGITLYSHPYGGALLNEDKILESIRQCGVALCIVLGFSTLTASIGSSVVKDRVTGAKRLQHISGLGHRTYWFTNFLYDMVFYLVSVCLCVAIISAFQLSAFTFRENLAATALLLALFGYATLPWMYLMSRIFSSSDVAFISYISLNFICGLCTMLITVTPRLLAIVSKDQNLQNIYNILKWVFTIFPQFCLGQGLIELCYNQIKYDLTYNFNIDSYVSPFEMTFLGWIFMELAFQGTVFLLLRLLLHWDLLRQWRVYSAPRVRVKISKDIDVEKEQTRVFEGRTSGDILVLHNLNKSYQSFFKRTTAVQDISLGIPRGECFGLLGVNGAGKSTTFKMLIGDIAPTSGHAVIRTPMGEEVALSSAGVAGVLIGYCPQQDALDDLLTGWEHLHYYCSLRGIPKQHIPEVAQNLVRLLHLEAHVDHSVGTYSGGTKRKLSTALALVGKPEILLLDEPSSGMDPCSKRYLWEAIMKEVREGCVAVLTSHSMEECESLCTRLAIMVNGSFRCLGPPQHIKNRFGDGYTVKVWLSKREDQHHTISDCLKLHFPGIQFKGQRLSLLEYHVPKRCGLLADLFTVLENNKTFLNIKHYCINQTTLEQVFINFATEQQQMPQTTLELSTDHYHPQNLPI